MQPRASLFLFLLSAACSSTHGSPSAADVTGDSGLSQVPYWQWYYPDCGAPGTCDNPGCQQVQLNVGPRGVCKDPPAQVTTGCVPSSQESDGVFLFATSDERLISTVSYPYTTDDLTTCVNAGIAPTNGRCCSWIDGGVSDLTLISGE